MCSLGSLLDRIDLHIDVPSAPFQEHATQADGTPSATMREQVQKAHNMRQGNMILAVLLVASLASPSFAVTKAPSARKYTLRRESTASFPDGKGNQGEITIDKILEYRLQRQGAHVTILCDAWVTRFKRNREPMREARLDRNQVIRKEDGKVVAVENSDPEMLLGLQESFGAPLCRYEVDEEGMELSREILAGKKAKVMLLDTGQLHDMRFFHVRFPARETSWRVTNKLSTAEKPVAGELVYEKTSAKDPRHPCWVRVRVTGELGEKAIDASKFSMRNVRYKLAGEQVFDVQCHEWVSGNHTIEASFDVYADVRKLGVCSGTTHLLLESNR